MTLNVDLLPQELESLDRIGCDLLLLTFFSDERPLRGVNGLADWRGDGRLSRLLIEGGISGIRGERTLMTVSHYLPAERLLAFGLGPSVQFDSETFVNCWFAIRNVMSKLNPKSIAMAVPGGDFAPRHLGDRTAVVVQSLAEFDDMDAVILQGRETDFKETDIRFAEILRTIERYLSARTPTGAEFSEGKPIIGRRPGEPATDKRKTGEMRIGAVGADKDRGNA